LHSPHIYSKIGISAPQTNCVSNIHLNLNHGGYAI
jgi:hypothetical protein